MADLYIPEGFNIGPIDEKYGTFEVFMDGRKDRIGQVSWHGTNKAYVEVKSDTLFGSKREMIGYTTQQKCLDRITRLWKQGEIYLPYFYNIDNPIDENGGFVLRWKDTSNKLGKGQFINHYVATISLLNNGIWAARQFDYGLTPSEIANSVKVIAKCTTRQEAIDSAINNFGM